MVSCKLWSTTGNHFPKTVSIKEPNLIDPIMKNQIRPNLTRFFFFFVLIVSSLLSFGQKEANIWYFGYGAGLDFNYDPPKPLKDGKMHTLEGCASVADRNGALLFYTDGSTVWDKNHTVVENGTDLKGDNSSTQSAVVVPNPGDITQYYIFTVSGSTSGRDGAHYSLIDLDRNNGGPMVLNKNKELISKGYGFESIGATKHKSQQAYWVCLIEDFNILAYLVDENGVSSKPVVSEIQEPNTMAYISFYMKFSSDNRFASVSVNGGGLYLFRFNAETGKFTSTIKVLNKYRYGVEFSPDSRYLYTSSLEQFDLRIYDEQTIQNSMVELDTQSNFDYWRAIQLAPNGKIYFCGTTDRGYLGVINDPNKPGTSCDLQHYGVKLSANCALGLPTFLQTYLSTNMYVEQTCLGDSTVFDLNYGFTPDSIKWSLLGQNLEEYRDQSIVKYKFKDTGLHRIQAEVWLENEHVVLIDSLRIENWTKLDLGDDIRVCEGEKVVLEPRNFTQQVKWQDRSVSHSHIASSSGQYHCSSDYRCTIGDTVNVQFGPVPKLDLGNDTTLCEGDTIILSNKTHETMYAWQDSTESKTHTVTQPGAYRISVDRDGCVGKASINITQKKRYPIKFGNDTVVCSTDTFELNPRGIPSLWQDGSIQTSYLVTQSGMFMAKSKMGECFTADSIFVDVIQTPKLRLPEDTLICLGFEFEIHVPVCNEVLFTWGDGFESLKRVVSDEGNYSLTLMRDKCEITGSVYVSVMDCQPVVEMPNIFSPNEDGLNDEFLPINTDNVLSAEINIFNRWGELIYNGDLLNKGWDGKRDGRNVATGTYFYMLNYTGFEETKHQLEGLVTLVR